jgi:hypothetical protein
MLFDGRISVQGVLRNAEHFRNISESIRSERLIRENEEEPINLFVIEFKAVLQYGNIYFMLLNKPLRTWQGLLATHSLKAKAELFAPVSRMHTGRCVSKAEMPPTVLTR